MRKRVGLERITCALQKRSYNALRFAMCNAARGPFAFAGSGFFSFPYPLRCASICGLNPFGFPAIHAANFAISG
jgi:hypothetical protein